MKYLFEGVFQVNTLGGRGSANKKIIIIYILKCNFMAAHSNGCDRKLK